MDNDYIWHRIQMASDENVYFVQERTYPSLIGEITGEDKDDNVRVNLKSRFSYLLDVTQKTNEYVDRGISMHDWELDLFLHFAAHVDLLSGYNKNNHAVDQLRSDFENESFGSDVAKMFKKLTNCEKDIFLRNYCSNENSLLASLQHSFKELYPEGLLYRKQDTIFLYVDKDETDEDNNKFELLRKLFVPMQMELKVHYKNHMGIIGIKETMKIGKIRMV